MKNIHIIPTDKPSKLWFNLKGKLVVDTVNCLYEDIQCQHIYITSDEEINQQTKPCWCINTIKNTWDADLSYYQGSMPQYHYKGFKKIILTTDQDLIKDDVQKIDDEFLEWFVKNPSCEVVEIEKQMLCDYCGQEHCDNLRCKGYKDSLYYEIIIPKEEPKHQQERMYSEEDIKSAFKVGFSIGYGSDVHAIDEKNKTCEEWFNKFKKK